MSALDPALPASGLTFTIIRDDMKTYAGVTVPAETYSLAGARAKLAAATGLSGPEIARANAIIFNGERGARDAYRFGPGWGIYRNTSFVAAYVLRDDGTHLSYRALPTLFTPAIAAAALNATAGLSGSETARIAAMAAALP